MQTRGTSQHELLAHGSISRINRSGVRLYGCCAKYCSGNAFLAALAVDSSIAPVAPSQLR